ncbi:hypothetical protein B0H13DRAFT_2352486 [Mycena leptocephala]|nr:hypothetical protein B0H13DRAFT_2352486 [Mycena leptocephala]
MHASALFFSSTSDHCLCQPACSVSVYASVRRSTSPRAPPAPSPSPRAGIQTRLRAPPAPVNTTLLAPGSRIQGSPLFFSPSVNCNRHPVRLRAQLEAEGQGTSLCTVCACSTPCSTSPAARPRAPPPLYPAPIAFHVVPSCRVSLGLSRPSILPSAPSRHPAQLLPPRFRLGPISFDLGVLRILVAIRQYSRHGPLAQSSIPGTHATPSRLAPGLPIYPQFMPMLWIYEDRHEHGHDHGHTVIPAVPPSRARRSFDLHELQKRRRHTTSLARALQGPQQRERYAQRLPFHHPLLASFLGTVGSIAWSPDRKSGCEFPSRPWPEQLPHKRGPLASSTLRSWSPP